MLVNRREALALVGAGMLASRQAAAEPLQFTNVDRVEFLVSDVDRSLAFYTRVFGATVLKNNRTTRRYVKLGQVFLAFDKGPQPGRVDHFCAGIPGFDVAGLHAHLKEIGVEYHDYPSGNDLWVGDPDGTRVQLGADNSWNQLVNATASPETVASGEAIFRPTGIDHVLLNVSDQEKAAAFFEKIFGPVAQRNNNRVWFQVGKSRVGLLQTPAGQKAGVNHFCVSAASFDYEASLKKLAAAGARLEAAEINGAPEFRDPDGLLVQVR